MGENLVKSHELRKALIKTKSNIHREDKLIEKSGELIGQFHKWKDIQQGRETSTGLKLLYKVIESSVPPALAALVTITMTDNKVATAVAAGVGGAYSVASNLFSNNASNKGGQTR